MGTVLRHRELEDSGLVEASRKDGGPLSKPVVVGLKRVCVREVSARFSC